MAHLLSHMGAPNKVHDVEAIIVSCDGHKLMPLITNQETHNCSGCPGPVSTEIWRITINCRAGSSDSFANIGRKPDACIGGRFKSGKPVF